MHRIPLALLAATMAMLVVGATHTPVGRCDPKGQPSLGTHEVSGGDAASTLYVDDRNAVTGNGLWIYLETNGVWERGGTHNLQRGATCGFAGCYPFINEAEICVDDPTRVPDLLVFAIPPPAEW